MSDLSIPYELRIGVTGHRKLADPALIEQAVERTLVHVRSALQSTSGSSGDTTSWGKRLDGWLLRAARLVWPRLPIANSRVAPREPTAIQWVAVSSLAKGADRIVARVVLSQGQEDGQARLQVVSPLALDEYRRDFVDPSDREEFEQLLGLDRAPTILHSEPAESGAPPDDSSKAQAERNQAYLAAGKRVVDSCELLIAIWDGQPARGLGGTADIVGYAMEQGRMVLWIDANHPQRPARMLSGSTVDARRSEEGVVNGFVHRPLPTHAKRLSLAYHRLAAYNRDPAYDRLACEQIFDRNRTALLRACRDAGLSETAIEAALNVLLPHYARADQLAIRYQQLYVRAGVGLQLLSSLAVTIVVVQVLFFPQQLWLILFEMLAMVLALVLLRISRREAWHEKWLRDRHLAERLRIALFTTIAQSAGRSPKRPADSLPFYQSPDDWIVETCDRLTAQARAVVPPAGNFERLKAFLVSAWIGQQSRYHAANAHRKAHMAHLTHRFGLVFFSVTLLMAILHLLGVGHGSSDDHHGHEVSHFWSHFITALAIALPAWGATTNAINTLLERERLSSRSAQMAKVLKQLALRAEQARSPEQLAEAISQAEEVMLMENHEWWVSLSFRPPILPA